VRNDGYEASPERNKIYESGEDYLFSADRFVAIEVPAAVRASLKVS
jgi:hypothetical protein